MGTIHIRTSGFEDDWLGTYGMHKKVPDDFDFFVKAHRDLTHVRQNAKATLPRLHEMRSINERTDTGSKGAYRCLVQLSQSR
jgi:uncharacterized protein YecE (DUF72 family)